MTSLNGSWSRDINLSYIASDGSLPLHLEVSLEEGTVRVAFSDDAGATVSETVTPDQSMILDTTTFVSNGQVMVTFEALDSPASGLRAVVEIGPA